MELQIKTNFPAIDRAMRDLQADISQAATIRAVNQTMAQAKTAMSKAIREEFAMPAAKVNSVLRITRASFKSGRFDIEAALQATSRNGRRSLNLSNFQARQTSKGVTFKIKKGGPRKLIPGAFLINGGRTVMIREGKKRLPIKALQTIDVAQMFNTKRINAQVVRVIQDRFPAIFDREVRYYTERFKGKKA